MSYLILFSAEISPYYLLPDSLFIAYDHLVAWYMPLLDFYN